jgi:hypothetical protein
MQPYVLCGFSLCVITFFPFMIINKLIEFNMFSVMERNNDI